MSQTRHNSSSAPSHDEKMQLDNEKPDDVPTIEEAPVKPLAGPGPPPNGGLLAWLHVLSSFMLYFNTWGILNAFGVFQTYYESGALFQETSSNISWIGGIAAFLLMFVGIFVGPIYDRGYLRALLSVGTFMIVFGHMMLSLCTEFWQVVLAQGFVVGIGTGCLFVPCVAILPQYFSTKLGAALGVAVAGSALGGVIYPIVLYQLINEIGFPWAVRVMGFIALATLIVPLCIARLRVRPPKVRAMLDASALKDIHYVAFVLNTLITYMGMFVIMYFISYYAAAKSITDNSLAFYLVPIFNAASVFGRTIPNVLADKWGPLNLLAPASLISGVLTLCMIAVHSKGAIIVLSLLSGFMSGALIGLPPLCFVALIKDKSKLGTWIGMGYATAAFGVLASGPIGGAILGHVPADMQYWPGLWVFGGVLCVVSGFGYAAIRIAKYGPKPFIKA